MIKFGNGVAIAVGDPAESQSGFSRIRTALKQDADGALLLKLIISTPGPATVEWLAPFNWDAGVRGVQIRRRELDRRVCLHSGAYATADAIAHRDGVPMAFPVEREGHRYLVADPPGVESDHQDAAGWVLIESGGRCIVLAWDYSAALTTEIVVNGGHLELRALLGTSTFFPDADSPVWGTPGPDAWLAVVPGDLDAGADALREFITTEVISTPDLSGMPGDAEFPCLVGNSWGVGEDVSEERIRGMMRAVAGVGAEVFVLDKGWERSVGDWHPGETFPEGLATLSAYARELGMGFGVWCGFGNTELTAPVVRDHPDWLATWRGDQPRLSFDTYAICLGHDPARDWILDELRRMVGEFGLTWLLHDFESIARCDSTGHTHDPGAGEHAAEAAWHHILRTLKQEFGQLVLENCWNGGRPLDLAMLRSHHTTITEDHCLVRWNSLAKHAIGRYLPLDWQSAYMGAEGLPPKARFAPYVIGGPWVLMDDQATWSDAERATLARATELFRELRSELRTARVSPIHTDRRDTAALQACTASGRRVVAVSVPAGPTTVTLPVERGEWQLTDGWTGEQRSVTVTDGRLELPCAAEGDGLLLILDPVNSGR